MLYNYRNIVIKKEGKAVPQDTIAKVLQTEEEMKRRREQTAAECRQKLLQAQRSAQRIREKARADTEAEVREMMSQAERQAAQSTYEALERASVEWEKKKQEARQRIPQAAGWIVEKVVNR